MKISFTKDTIVNAANQIWQTYKSYAVWAFHAPMGSGKTTFISALCKEVLEVKDTVSSPTYAIINQYQSAVAGAVYHIDLYRLKNEEEAVQAGVEDAIAASDLCLIEWSEIAPSLLPENCLHIYLTAIDAATRTIEIK